MLLTKEILEMILGSKKDCNTVYNILSQSQRDHHGKITSIDIPNEAENLFWRIIIEFETLHFQWGDWSIASSSSNNADINDIVKRASAVMAVQVY